MSDKILIVDDEVEIADLIETYLKNEDYAVYKFYSAKDALACINETELDLAVLDVMLPDADGFTICRKIREKHTYPVIMLTAKDAEAVTLKLYHRQIKIFVFLIDIFCVSYRHIFLFNFLSQKAISPNRSPIDARRKYPG